MKKIVLFLSICFVSVFGVEIPQGNFVGGSVVPSDETYYKHTQGNVEIIYTKEHENFAEHVLKLEPALHNQYENFYAWVLDEKLSVGLISNNNQIANGFSTQMPNNRQINYVGGTAFIDYFTTTSWLDTLLYHETAHNYQVNVKDSAISQSLHNLFGNGSFFIPTFIVPNYTENAFMLEGNAVLNESWHGNGGRLYSGRFKAQTILQAKAGKINPGEVYNSKIEFPYGEIVYIQGGFYNYYMAQKYGLKNINSYFKYHSQDWYWPFFTNASMGQATGIDFEDSLREFANEYASKDVLMAQGELIASSQFFNSINSDAQEIYFLTNESGRRASELVKIDKETKKITKNRDSWSPGKLIKDNSNYYTQSSANISATKIMQGLYDSTKSIKDDTASKMVQGYLSDSRMVYFDVALSYSQAQLFVGDEFYAQVNSSVYIDTNDKLYYFVQKDKTRTLFRDKTPLFSIQGFYSIVSDVDSTGGIYFIANSKNGSSLYLFKDEKISRVSRADNIVEAKLINDDEVLLAAISDKDYYYVISELEDIQESPFDVKLYFEDNDYYANIDNNKDMKTQSLDDTPEYNSLFDMRYSGTDFMIGSGVNNSLIGTLNLKFADPLTQNAFNIFANRDENNTTIAGAGYQSALSILSYGVSLYKVVDNNNFDIRDSGVLAYAELPLYKAGYTHGKAKLSYYQDYDTFDREPLSFELSLYKMEHFGVSMYENYMNYISAYMTKDRDDYIYGAKYSFKHDIAHEFYFSFDAKYSATSSVITGVEAYVQKRGVKVSQTSFSADLDPSLIDMRSISENTYLRNAAYVDVGLAKVLNFSSYWFTFPISLQRESVYAKYKYFALEDFRDEVYNVAEVTAGFSASVVLFNNLALPFSFEYIYNDTFFATDKTQFFFSIGSSF